jgi:hypothetical protein
MKHYCSVLLVSAILCLSVLSISNRTYAIEGFRGSSWGELRYDIPTRNGKSDLWLYGWAKQGIDWARWGNTTLNTYATIRYSLDTEKLDWNSHVGPGVGIGIDTYSPKGIAASWGVEYLWDRYYESARTEQKVVVYMNWFGWWDLKKKP